MKKNIVTAVAMAFVMTLGYTTMAEEIPAASCPPAIEETLVVAAQEPAAAEVFMEQMKPAETTAAQTVAAEPEATEIPAIAGETETPEVPAQQGESVETEMEASAEEPVSQEIDVSAMHVEIFSDMGDCVQAGARITLTSKLTGFEGVAYTLAWEYDDGNGWKAMEGANGESYTFTANAQTVNYAWRLSVDF